MGFWNGLSVEKHSNSVLGGRDGMFGATEMSGNAGYLRNSFKRLQTVPTEQRQRRAISGMVMP